MKCVCATLGLVSCVALASESLQARYEYLNQIIEGLEGQLVNQYQELKESLQAFNDICKKLHVKARWDIPPNVSSPSLDSQNSLSLPLEGPNLCEAIADTIDVLTEKASWMKVDSPSPYLEVNAAWKVIKDNIKKFSELNLLGIVAALEQCKIELVESRLPLGRNKP